MEKKEIVTLLTVTAVAVTAIGIGISRNHSRKTAALKTVEETLKSGVPSPEIESVLIAQVETAFEEHPPFQPSEAVVETAETGESIPLEYNGEGAVGWTFSEAFADARTRLGPGETFIWNGRHFTTLYAEELDVLAADSASGENLAAADTLEPQEKPDTTATEEE